MKRTQTPQNKLHSAPGSSCEKAKYLDWSEKEAQYQAQRNAEIESQIDVSLEREIAALDALFDDADAAELLRAARLGNDQAAQDLADYAQEIYGLNRETILEAVRIERGQHEQYRKEIAAALESKPVQRDIQDGETEATDRPEPISDELKRLFERDIASLTPADTDPYLEALEKWRNRAITKADVPKWAETELWARIRDVRRHRHEFVKAKLLLSRSTKSAGAPAGYIV